MTILAFETSCDETGAAVVRDGKVLANVVSSQTQLHTEYGGVVPELAAREHLKNLQPIAQTALREAGISTAQLDGVAATQGPGLAIALIVGYRAAQAVAFALDKPFMGINHHEAHLYSPWIQSEPKAPSPPPLQGEGIGVRSEPCLQANFACFQPNVSLIVSGGHTLLVRVDSETSHRVLGGTMDDAAGECFDKTGKLMGLAYPAGPEIDRLAEQGNPAAYAFPRPLMLDRSDDFSFSGLKTSVRYFIRDHPEIVADKKRLCDLCASVQAAIVEVLVKKTVQAARRERVRCVTASGGVICNRALRTELALACKREGFALHLADKMLCTDNAAMIGILAERRLLHHPALPSLAEEVKPGWVLA